MGVKTIYGEQLAARSCYRSDFAVGRPSPPEVNFLEQVPEEITEVGKARGSNQISYKEPQVKNLDEVSRLLRIVSSGYDQN